ncbi:MAG: DNA mismatch repair protein MutS [Firmicutes bacterium ADurb.Bin182]|nr:MAG: DNA mismatch repair protein MutS [Firmicutes bacterium ADurb.Bin182]
MLDIGFEQKRETGLQYILDSMTACTPYGAELIKRTVPYASEQKAELIVELNNIERAVLGLAECGEDYRLLMQQLSLFKDIRRSLKKCMELPLSEVELFEIKRFLINLRSLVPLFETVDRSAGFENIELIGCESALKLLDPDEKSAAGFHISGSYSERLKSIRKEKREIEERIRRESDKDAREQLMQQRLITAAAEDAEEAKVRKEISKKLRAYVPDLEHNINCIARLDTTIQKALIALKYGAVKPEISDHVSFTDMINPMLSDKFQKQGRAFVPISVELKFGSTVITGANMGGKSVALKTIALNVMLCQMGFFAFAKSASIPVFDSMRFLFKEPFDPEYSLSSFGSEIIWLNEAASDIKNGRPVLIIADEFARGTNPDEGALIVRAVVKVFDSARCVAVFSTHYDQASQCASCHYQVKGLKNADIKKLAEKITDAKEGLKIIAKSMDYGLYKVEGKADCPRDALNICRLLALDKSILDEIKKSY